MRLRLVGMLAMTGALTGYFVSVSLPHRYIARSTLRVIRPSNLTKENYDEDSRRMADAAAEQVLSKDVLTGLIDHDARLRDLLMVEPMPELTAKIREGTRIYTTSLPGGANGIRVEYEDDEAEPALDIGHSLTVLTARVANVAAHYSDKRDATEVAEAPRAYPTGATVPLSTGIGLGMGLALGCIMAASTRPGRASPDPERT